MEGHIFVSSKCNIKRVSGIFLVSKERSRTCPQDVIFVTASTAIIVFLVYLYSYDEFCSILFSYLIILGAPLFGSCSGR